MPIPSPAKPTVEIDPEQFRETDQLVGNAEKLRRATGWQPRISLRSTLLKLLDGWRAHFA